MNQENSNLNKQLTDIVVWTALVTPFTLTGEIDYDSLNILAQKQAGAGNGILLLGSTGEGLALNSAEQYSVVEYVCNLALKTPIMVAVGGFNLTDQLAWIDKCNALNISAYLLGSTIYAKPGKVGQTRWFSQLLEQSHFPCMLYNVPSRSGCTLDIEMLSVLQSHKNCWALKEASGDLQQFLSYKKACPSLALYSGEDAMMPYLAPAGVKGLVSVCANVWPDATQKYVQQTLLNENSGNFPVWHDAVDALFQVASPTPVKVLLHLTHQINQPNLRLPLSHLELESTQSLEVANKSIQQWLVENN